MDSYKFERRGRFYFVCDCGAKHKFTTEKARDEFAATQNCAKDYVKEPEKVLETIDATEEAKITSEEETNTYKQKTLFFSKKPGKEEV